MEQEQGQGDRAAQPKKSFDVLVPLRWAMKNALVAAPSFG
jgi:hypothetical protein